MTRPLEDYGYTREQLERDPLWMRLLSWASSRWLG